MTPEYQERPQKMRSCAQANFQRAKGLFYLKTVHSLFLYGDPLESIAPIAQQEALFENNAKSTIPRKKQK